MDCPALITRVSHARWVSPQSHSPFLHSFKPLAFAAPSSVFVNVFLVKRNLIFMSLNLGKVHHHRATEHLRSNTVPAKLFRIQNVFLSLVNKIKVSNLITSKQIFWWKFLVSTQLL